MKLTDLEAVVSTAVEATNTQASYAQLLGAKVQAGEKTIEVFDKPNNIWTMVKLLDFWQIQYDKYIAMAGYSGDMATLLGNLQATLDAQLPTIMLPEDRIRAAEAAKA